MADFTGGQLPDPQRVYSPSGGGADSSAGIIGGALGGLSQIAGAVFKREGETARAQEGNDLAKQISDLVMSNSSSKPTPLVGQGTGDPMTDAGVNSTTGKQLNTDLNRVGAASSQGTMSETEILTRSTALVQDAITKDPLHADYYRNLAKETLGVSPTAELFAMSNKAAEFDRGLAQEVAQTNTMAAANAGVTILTPDGQPDLQKMAAAGASILQTDKDVAKQLQAAQLASAQAGTKLSHTDQVSLEVNTAMGGLYPIFEQVHGSLLNNLPALVAKYGAAGRDQTVAQLSVDLNNNQAQTMNYIDGFIIKNHISPEAAKQIRDESKSMFDDYRTLFGDPKQSLDQISANARTLKDAQTLGQLNFRKQMPVAAKIKDVVGDQGIAALFAQDSILNANVQSGLQRETGNFLQGKPTATDVASLAASAMIGDYNVSQEQRPHWQSAVTTGLVKTATLLSQTPDKLSPQQQAAFGHSMVQISNVALNDKSPKNLENAASIINTPAMMRTFLNFAKNDANADHTPIVALGMNSLLYQHIAAARRVLIQGETTSFQLPQPHGNVDPLVAARAGYGPAQNITVHAGAVYNPQSGQMEFQMKAEGPDGKDYKLTAQQAQESLKDFSAYRNSVLQVNRSLDAMTVLKDYTHDGSDQFKPLEMKGIAAQSAGMPIKAGMSIPQPKVTQQESDTRSFADKVNSPKLEGGAPDAKNPRSSASGYGQFIKGTWLDLAKKSFPDEVKGLNDTQILNLRNDKAFSDKMIDAYKTQNASKLKAAGIENPDEADLYMAHHFGAEGAIKIMNAPIRGRLEDILSPEVMKANPDLKGKTPLDIYKKYSAALSGQSG